MPTRPARICAKAGCCRKTRARFCDRHAPAEEAKAKASAWGGDKPSASQRGYGSRWRTIRKMILARDPFCAVCSRNPSRDVDHIVPKYKGGTDDPSNLQGLCSWCHDRKAAREGQEASRNR